MDTLFFIARKKSDHLSVLHIIHHAFMPLFSWIGLKFVANMNIGFIPWINSFTHLLMYTYYGLSAMGPSVRKHLWWKKYITTIQIVQIAMIGLQSAHFLLVPGCNMYGNAFIFLVLLFTGLNLYLFSLFFQKRYLCLKES